MMIDKRYHAFARIVPKAEYFEAARTAVLDIISRTQAEPGCDVFILHEGIEAGDQALYVYEVFHDETAFHFHHEQIYTKDVFKKYEFWLAEPVVITRLRRIS